MKRFLMFFFLLPSMFILRAQKVDSIRVEQNGDFIKIRYKILNSKPGEIYRVRVLCSINGGLNTELRSVSGDVGDHVQGGLPEYWVVWDVLKDVEEVKTVDFIVRAELAFDPSKTSAVPAPKTKVNATGWDKKNVNIMLASMLPGPKTGLRAGYLGNFGCLVQLVAGRSLTRPISVPAVENFDPPKKIAGGVALTKRIVNSNGFQMHITAGIQMTHTVYYDTNAPDNQWSMQNVKGIEFGLAFGIKRIALSVEAVNFDPAQIERGSKLIVASPRTYISACAGVRF